MENSKVSVRTMKDVITFFSINLRAFKVQDMHFRMNTFWKISSFATNLKLYVSPFNNQSKWPFESWSKFVYFSFQNVMEKICS